MSSQSLSGDKDRVKAHQMAMARNIAKLRNKRAQKQQAHLLCESIRKCLAGGAK